MAIGTITPPASVVAAWTSAPDGMPASIDAIAGPGPVTVKVCVSMLPGIYTVLVEVASVTWTVVVAPAVGIRKVWSVPSIVTLYVDWERMRAGAESARPRREIVKNILGLFQ